MSGAYIQKFRHFCQEKKRFNVHDRYTRELCILGEAYKEHCKTELSRQAWLVTANPRTFCKITVYNEKNHTKRDFFCVGLWVHSHTEATNFLMYCRDRVGVDFQKKYAEPLEADLAEFLQDRNNKGGHGSRHSGNGGTTASGPKQAPTLPGSQNGVNGNGQGLGSLPAQALTNHARSQGNTATTEKDKRSPHAGTNTGNTVQNEMTDQGDHSPQGDRNTGTALVAQRGHGQSPELRAALEQLEEAATRVGQAMGRGLRKELSEE